MLREEIRYHNVNDFNQYIQKSGDLLSLREDIANLTVYEQMEEFMFLGLRCMKGISPKEFCRSFGRSLESVYGNVIDKHIKNGLLHFENGWISLTRRGLDLANSVFADFLLDV